MVRLEVAIDQTSEAMAARFNSSMVRLEGLWNYYQKKEGYCFNSSMVRLEDIINNLNGEVYCVFQFQYGTIRSR